MKKTGIMNSEISCEISKIGHTQYITICDAGLPIPNNIKRIDLSIIKNLPTFLQVLDPILSEMEVEELIIAEEIKKYNPEILSKISSYNKKISFISHEEFKKLTSESQAIIRTGECSPYANIILKAGVTF